MTTLTPDLIADLERRRRADEQRPYAVARECFTYVDRVVGPVTINHGEIVHDLRHPAVVRHPAKFDISVPKRGRGSRPELNAPAALMPAPARTPTLVGPAWALPIGDRGLTKGEPIELGDSKSPITVTIAHRVRDAITRHAEAVPPGFETGGLLFAHRQRDTRIQLRDAWRPGAARKLRQDSMELDWLAEFAEARRYCATSARRTTATAT